MKGVLNELALFAGAGGGLLASRLLGWRTVCCVERDAYAASVLVARQNERLLDACPIWDDVCTFDGRPWKGVVDVISGGFPCQDVSAAGTGKGIAGERSGLWTYFARIVGDVEPTFVFAENSPLLTGRGLERVVGDLASLGYDARWCVLGAHHVGAPHRRDRIWILGYRREAMAHSHGTRLEEQRSPLAASSEHETPQRRSWWASEPVMGRVANGVANRVDRLRCLGNGQVPQVAELAWRTLTDGLEV